MSEKGPLDGVRVLDLTDEKAIYGAKMLADLGAKVIRPEGPGGDPLRKRGPFKEGHSLWHMYFASNRHCVRIADEDRQRSMHTLVEHADILMTSTDGFGVADLDLDTLAVQYPRLVIVDTTAFGREGPWKDYAAPDLVAGALGGAVATTGDADTVPFKTFGELNFMVSGVYAAIAALSALHRKHEDGLGQRVDLSVHECIASCLEHVMMVYWYHEKLGREPVLPRRGSLHWSDLYCVYPVKNGGMMMTPAPDYDKQLVWLIEEGVHEDLLDPKYNEPENLRERGAKVMDIMKRWAADKDAETFFFEAQSRHAPYGWVLPPKNLAENEQLAARKWFRDIDVAGDKFRIPGAPYQFSDTPWQAGTYQTEARAADDVLADIGWGSAS